MSRFVIIILIHQHHKTIDLIYAHVYLFMLNYIAKCFNTVTEMNKKYQSTLMD
jgi:hypothetical protein